MFIPAICYLMYISASNLHINTNCTIIFSHDCCQSGGAKNELMIYFSRMCNKGIAEWGADQYLNIHRCWVIQSYYIQSVHLLFSPKC